MKSLLFLGVANSARSQMAEDLVGQTLGPDDTIQSTGSKPPFVQPMANQALAPGASAAGQLESFRSVRDGIADRLYRLKQELVT